MNFLEKMQYKFGVRRDWTDMSSLPLGLDVLIPLSRKEQTLHSAANLMWDVEWVDKGKDIAFEFNEVVFLFSKQDVNFYFLVMNTCPDGMDFVDYYDALSLNMSAVIDFNLFQCDSSQMNDVGLKLKVNVVPVGEDEPEKWNVSENDDDSEEKEIPSFAAEKVEVQQDLYDSDFILAAVAEPVQPCQAVMVLESVQLAMDSCHLDEFAGTQSSCLSNSNKDRLFKQNYRVALKADGIRYFMVIHQGVGFFVNRRMNVFRWRAKPTEMPNMVLDGELLCGKDKKTIYFVVFDSILMGSTQLMGDSLKMRLDCCRASLSVLNNQLLALSFNLKFIVQDYAPLSYIATVIKQRDTSVIPDDGLIFLPSDTPYAKGYSKQVMKLKDLKNSTLDFKVLSYCDEPFIVVLTTMKGIRFVHYDFSTLDEMRGKEGKVVECYWDPDYLMSVPSREFSYREGGEKKMMNRLGAWRWKRDRDDKNKPNSHWVADELRLLFKNPLTEQGLVDFVERNKEEDPKHKVKPGMKRNARGRGRGRFGCGRRRHPYQN